MSGTRFSLEVQPRIPDSLQRFDELANDLFYSWDRQVRRLFTRLDKELWSSCGHNPRTFLRRVSQQRLAMGPEFNQLSGEDPTALAFNAHGGHGCISVTSNVAPALCAEFQRASLAGDFAKALELHDRLMPLHEALFVESSPGPVKYAAELLGLCSAEARLPLVPVAESTKKRVRDALVNASLLDG